MVTPNSPATSPETVRTPRTTTQLRPWRRGENDFCRSTRWTKSFEQHESHRRFFHPHHECAPRCTTPTRSRSGLATRLDPKAGGQIPGPKKHLPGFTRCRGARPASLINNRPMHDANRLRSERSRDSMLKLAVESNSAFPCPSRIFPMFRPTVWKATNRSRQSLSA